MKNILIIGSGIIGICTGIELIRRGYSVTLMDPNQPGSQTSYGNAGVISDSSLMVINNPQLRKSLFQLIFTKQTSFRYSKFFIFLRLSWILRFLIFSHKNHMEFAAKALREFMPNMHLAVIYAKPRGLPLANTYVEEITQETWPVFPWDEEDKANH